VAHELVDESRRRGQRQIGARGDVGDRHGDVVGVEHLEDADGAIEDGVARRRTCHGLHSDRRYDRSAIAFVQWKRTVADGRVP